MELREPLPIARLTLPPRIIICATHTGQGYHAIALILFGSTYEGLVSRHNNWQYSVVAWSGRGMVRNYGDKNITSAQPLPYYYPFSVATQGTVCFPNTGGQSSLQSEILNSCSGTLWNFTSWVPDIVFINLGTNDYSTQPQPPRDVFVSGPFLAFTPALAFPSSSNPPCCP